MAYNLKLAERIRAELQGLPIVEKKMFVGVGFILNGNMACGILGNDLLVRVPPDKHLKLLARPHTKPFAMTGKPMKGWLVVETDGCKTAKQLSKWVKEGIEFALTLPPK